LTTGKPRCLSTDPACPRFYWGVAGFAFIFAECKTGNRHRTHKAQNVNEVLRFRSLPNSLSKPDDCGCARLEMNVRLILKEPHFRQRHFRDAFNPEASGRLVKSDFYF